MSPWHRLLTDAALVERARRDDAGAFEELVRRHQRSAHAVAAALGVAPANRDDVVQESFLRAFRGLPGVQEAQKFGAWLRQIARRESLRSLARSPRDAAANDLDVAAGEQGDDIEGAELRERVAHGVQTLPPELREAIFAYYYQGLSTRRAARSLGISASSFKHRLQRGRDLLRVRLGRELAAALGVPAGDRAGWARRARTLSLVLLAALPAASPALASGAAVAGSTGTRLIPWIQAGIMTTRNIALSVTLAIVIAGSIATWWLASARPRQDLAARQSGVDPAAALPAPEEATTRGVATPAGSAGATLQSDPALAATQNQDPPSLQGRVLDVRGQPVANARILPMPSRVLGLAMERAFGSSRQGGDPFTQIRAFREDIRRRLHGAAEAVTDDSGHYALRSLGAGEHRVIVLHPSFLPLTDAWVEVTGDGTATRDVILEDGARISGRILTRDGAPLAGATVSANRAERRGVKGVGSAMALAVTLANGTDVLAANETSTGASGGFELGSLAPGIYDVRAARDGYLAGTLENIEAGAAIELRLSPARTLRGRIVGAGGSPLPSSTATIRAASPAGDPSNPAALLVADVDLRDEKTRSADAAGDGTFVLHPSEVGLYEIVLRAPRCLETRRVERLGERDLDLGTVKLASGRGVRGVVRTATGAPAEARVSVRAGRPDGSNPAVMGFHGGAMEIASARTGEAGRFELYALPEEDLVLVAVDDGAGVGKFELRAGAPADVEIRIAAGGDVTGVVTDASTQEPIAGAKVTLSQDVVRGAVTGADGGFRFAGAAAGIGEHDQGHVHLTVEHPRYRPSLQREIWAPGASLGVALSALPVARGVVVDSSGSPVTGARLSVDVPGLPADLLLMSTGTSSPSSGAFSDAAGAFELHVGMQGPAGAELHIVAAHPALGRGRARIVPGRDEVVRIELRPGSRVEAVVRDAGGAPVKQARVALHRAAEASPEVALFKDLLAEHAGASGLTGEDGRAVLRDVEPGAYDVVAGAAGFATTRLSVEVASGRATVEVVLEPGRELSGRVIDQMLAPVPGAEVVAFDLDAESTLIPSGEDPGGENERQIAGIRDAAGRGAAAATTDEQGRFALGDLAPGRFRLIVRGESFAPAHLDGVEPGHKLPDIRVERFASLALRVRDARTGAFVTRFQVQLSPQEGQASRARAGSQEVASLDGKFARDKLPAGGVGVEVRAPGYAPWMGLVNLTAGTRREVEVVLPPGRQVSGVVRSAETKQPIAGASVVLFAQPSASAAAGDAEVLDGEWFQSGTATTDDSGRFTIADARDGELQLRVQHPELYDASAQSRGPVIVGGEDVELEPIELASGGVIAVTVEGWRPPAEPGVYFCIDAIGAAPAARPELRPSQTAVIDAEGRCRITGLPPGLYELQLRPFNAAAAPGFEGGPRPLGAATVEAGKSVEVKARAP